MNDVKDCIEQITKKLMITDKAEMILFHQIIIGGTIVGDDYIRYSKEVKIVGVWLDQHMTMNKHVNSLVSHCYHLTKDGYIASIKQTSRNTCPCSYFQQARQLQ